MLSEYEASLRQTIADNLLIEWAPTSTTGTILRTAGGTVGTTLLGTTGNRKKFTVDDLKKAQLALSKQNVPMEGRYALISADMFQQLSDDMSATQYRDFSAAYDVKDGVIGRLFGFNIMMRSGVVTYNNASTPVVNAYGATPNASDNDGVLCWQAVQVVKAARHLRKIKAFQDDDTGLEQNDVG